MSFRVGATAGDSGPSRYSEESESGPRGLQTQGADVLARLAENWPALAALRAAASSRQRSRLPAEVSSLVNELRVAFAAALLVSMPDDRGFGRWRTLLPLLTRWTRRGACISQHAPSFWIVVLRWTPCGG